jgi:hypothetical protein
VNARPGCEDQSATLEIAPKGAMFVSRRASLRG